MSGIAGIFQRDRGPLNGAFLQAAVEFLSYRGPDSQMLWSEESIGFAHALLRTAHEPTSDHQPASIKGQLSITADARIDCRTELKIKLENTGCQIESSLGDSALILHAYKVWGPRCVDYLIGDFAFAIWDARTSTLFCARDHFGIKPFYYVELSSLFVFSNTLNCVRLHPSVSVELNEAAIADFLLFGLNCDNATTSFRDIRRLPPAHFLIVSRDSFKIERYWTPPTDRVVRYRDADEYVHHFQTLLQSAVNDRLRTKHVGILLSGGLDSASVAATAKKLSINPGGTDLSSFTIVYESLLPDVEGPHARKVAQFLNIPNLFIGMDRWRPFEGWENLRFSWPEPVDDPLFLGFLNQFRIISKDCRVLLSGEGNDNLMYFEMWPYVRNLLRNGSCRTLVTQILTYLWLRPSFWPGIMRRTKSIFVKNTSEIMFPPWIAPDFARRVGLEARWKAYTSLPIPPVKHPTRPKSHASLYLPQWTLMFELQNAGVTNVPVEVCYPFLDLRIVNYLLGLPSFPFLFQKKLLRDAMAGQLPEGIRLRKKTPLQGDPLVEHAKRLGNDWVDSLPWNEKMAQFVDLKLLSKLPVQFSSDHVSSSSRPQCLNLWLGALQKFARRLENGKS